MSPETKRRLFIAALACARLALQSKPSAAISLQLELACASDYYAYCSKYDPSSSQTRSCMRANGEHLSKRCVNALVAAGEVSKSEAEGGRQARK